VVVPESGALNALGIAERLRRAIDSHPVAAPHGAFHVTASFGVAASTEVRPLDPQSLLSLADDALYRAKRSGRNRVELALYADSTPLESGSR
jgi:diguanylate cyclase (GGDEF)-like protein